MEAHEGDQQALSPLGQAAIEYARRGWHVFPCGVGSKFPAISGSKGHHDATDEIAQIVQWWSTMPDANIGLNLRKSSLLAVDVDIYKPECEWKGVLEQNALPDTLVQRSARGGIHYIFSVSDGNEFPKELCQGVDLKRNGYILLEPSTFEGGEYTFENDDDIAVAPEWIPRRKVGPKPVRVVRPDDTKKDEETWEILNYVDPDAAGYDGWLDIIMGIHERYDGSAKGFEIAEAWSSRGAKFEDDDIRNRWAGLKAAGGTTWASVCHAAREAGADLSEISRRHSEEAAALQLLGQIQERAAAAGGGELPPSEDDDEWEQQLIRNKSGGIIPNVANLITILEFSPTFEGCFALDEFTQKKTLTLPIPGSRTPRAGFRGRDWRDDDYTSVQTWFQRNGMPTLNKTVVVDAVDAVFEATRYNALQNYIDSLPPFDPGTETKRIGSWLHTYCGVEITGNEAKDRYVREVGARWLMSAVARAIKPGCKADCVLILEGRQGARKSTALSILAGAEWFGDSLPPMGSKDAKEYVRGKWIIEMAELANMNKAEVEEVKAFISRQEESFRPAYGRTERRYPRQCIFAGTTNKSDYLRDETGNRRFWPVKVGDKIDTDGLRRDRDKLWAEALYYVQKGMDWWLPEDVEIHARQEVKSRLNEDPWEASISAYCENRVEVCVAEILRSALAVEVGRASRADSNRIASTLRGLGFEISGKITTGDFKGAKRFARKQP